MKKKYTLILSVLLSLGIIFVGTIWFQKSDIAVLNPQGIIAVKERDLLVTATLLMLIIVIPVFLLACFIVWKYRTSNHKATYMPDWDFNALAETAWWGLPCVIIFFLSVITWKSSHDLDPFKGLSDINTKPLTVQVVALRWKWLFIYPEYNIATVNYLKFPEKTPLNFEITSDAPMNSFWIPHLGGQIYAMPGMKTKLHLMADGIGEYNGASANLSGIGFSGMKFIAKSVSKSDFQNWVQSVQGSSNTLDFQSYKRLLEPSENNPESSYSLTQNGLFDWIIMKYMMPMSEEHESHTHSEHSKAHTSSLGH